MEEDILETFSFYLPIAAAVIVVCVSGLELYMRIRHKLPYKANCWFCNKNTEVSYINRNSWECPNCYQYNGFSSDGGYNKEIPAQHDEFLNVFSPQPMERQVSTKREPVFCARCNHHLELKIRQLASFEPSIPTKYDEEIEQYSKHLENIYRLCSSCEVLLTAKLRKQKEDLHLTNAVPEIQFSSSKVSRFNKRNLSHGVQILTSLLALIYLISVFVRFFSVRNIDLSYVTSYASLFTHPYFAVTNAEALKFMKVILKYDLWYCLSACILQITAVVIADRVKKFGILSAMFWMSCLAIDFVRIKDSGRHIKMYNLALIEITIVYLTTVSCMASIWFHKESESFKIKSKGHRRNAEDKLQKNSNPNIPAPKMDNSFPPKIVETEKEEMKDSPAPIYMTRSKVKNLGKKMDEVCGELEKPSSILRPGKFFKNKFLPNKENLPKPEVNIDEGMFNLTLGTPSKRESGWRNSFEKRVYDQDVGSDIFRPVRSTSPLLTPSKFNVSKNITQTSWVAGGYWQNPNNFGVLSPNNKDISSASMVKPFSRCSSQSSGFESQTSQLPVENLQKAASSLGEFDTMSERGFNMAVSPYSGRISPPSFVASTVISPMMQPPAYMYPPMGFPVFPTMPFTYFHNSSPVGSFMNSSNYFVPPKFSFSPDKDVSWPISLLNNSANSQSSSEAPVKTTVKSVKSTIQENPFLIFLFCSSLLFNFAFIALGKWSEILNIDLQRNG